jgi:hypothetical protein
MTAPGSPDQQPAAPSPDGNQAWQQTAGPADRQQAERPAPVPGRRAFIPFQEEIRSAISYERGLAVKAAVALLLVGILLLAHVLWLT